MAISLFRLRQLAMDRNRHVAEEHVIVMNGILGELPRSDREALARFYVDGQPHEEIEKALAMDPDYFRGLRAFVRGEFAKRTRRGA